MLRISAISTGWQFFAASWRAGDGHLGFGKLEPLPAQVPGHVLVDLMRNGVIAHPSVGLNEIGVQWVDGEHWVYRVEFDAEPTDTLPHRRLRFDGLDTVTRISLNGREVAFHDNMFVPLEVNVDALLRPGKNQIEVHLEPATDAGKQRRSDYFRQHGLSERLVRFEERAFLRKAAYMFGWDWGPRLVSAGIWKPVNLLEFASRIKELHVQQEHQVDGSVRVSCVAKTEGAGRLVHFLQAPGENTWARAAEGEAIHLSEPVLWWPVALGAQALYELRSYLLPLSAAAVSTPEQARDIALDVWSTRVGLRQVSLVQESDTWGRSFRFEVNGRRVWVVGANWIPDDSFPSQVTRERLRVRLLQAVSMNMNMLRVWGGGYYESDDFYELCDELGLLVWQDFPFACSYAPDDEAAIDVAEKEARVAILRLRNHPSLALWCGNNETSMMFEAKWDDATKHPERCLGERIWDEVLPGLVKELDATRAYIPTSPFSPDASLPANADQCGDQHNWDVWHGRGDWIHYRESRARFASEFGFASSPSLAAWKDVFGDVELETIDVRHLFARWHDKTKKGYETFIAFAERHYGAVQTLEDWTYTSQLNQRDALTVAVEHYRASDFCNGSLIWQLNDCWPVQSWSVLDHTGALKAAAVELRRLYAPSLACLNVGLTGETPRLEVSLLLDNLPRAFSGALTIEARDSRTGECLRRWECWVELAPGERRVVLQEDCEGLHPRRTVIWCDWAGFEAKRLFCEPRDLELTDVSWRASREGNEVVLQASGPALDVWVIAPRVETPFFSLRAAGQMRIAAPAACCEVKLRWLGGVRRVRISEQP